MKLPPRNIKTVLIPVGPGNEGQTALFIAQAIGAEVILVGIVPIAKNESVSAGARIARQVRKRLFALSSPTIHFKSTVIVSDQPWDDLRQVIAQEKPDLFMIDWENGQPCCGIPIADLLTSPICNIAIAHGVTPIQVDRVVIAVRGGPFAELAFRMGMGLQPVQLDVLHLALPNAMNDAPFKGLKHILRNMPEVNLRSITTNDASQTILEQSHQYNIVIMGATADTNIGKPPLGPVAERLLQESDASVIVVKTCRSIPASMLDERAGVQAISILVDRWFAENTFHADEFSNLKRLIEQKEKQGATISLALPSLNEEETVEKVITTIKKALMDDVPLLDEIVLIDSNSTDHTRKIVEGLGIPVYIHQKLLPSMGNREGKGEGLWKSLLVTKGNIIAWIDTDIVNIHPRFVYGILGPLLLNRSIQFVKGFYRRPIRVEGKLQAGGGGRVTELTARPLLNLFYPELSGVVQPLSGEYAGRRESLEKMVFFSGYGVEMGLLIGIFEAYGLRSIAQVDLMERIHHNQGLEALSKMSFAIIQTVLRKLESRYDRSIVEDVNKTMKLIRRANDGYFLEVEEVAELERPPMITIPEYQSRGKKS
jgi:glycosyltransferase involved in cell wall biosynthesis